MNTVDHVPPAAEELERAYRADGTFILSLAPWMFIVGMSIELVVHWRVGPALVFWAHAAMAAASAILLVALRRKAVGQHAPDGWLLLFWSFMLCSVTVHAIGGFPDALRISQLVLAVTVVATGGLILPTVAGSFALAAGATALFGLFVLEDPADALRKAAIPVVVAFMGVLVFLARRWAIRQSVTVRRLDAELARTAERAESARRTADLSMRLAAGFAHHFNNQLQGALLGADGIRRSVEPGHPAGEWLDIVEGSVRRGIGLTGQLLRYAQPVRLNPRPLKGSEFLDGIGLSSATTAGRPIIRHAADVGFTADATQLAAAVVELVRNADAAMPEPVAPIRIEVIDSGETVDIEVTDAGRGVPTSLEGRPTEPFVTGDPVRRFGLGLSIAEQIVRRHQGALDLRPAPGGGTVARIRLPKTREGPQ